MPGVRFLLNGSARNIGSSDSNFTGPGNHRMLMPFGRRGTRAGVGSRRAGALNRRAAAGAPGGGTSAEG
jgi:hypothetical protein